MFTKATEYAIRALIFISNSHASGKARVGLKEISREIDIPERFTANILQDLSRRKVISSAKGPQGGFYIPDPSAVSLMDIVTAIEGTQQFERCGLGISECDARHPCPLHNQFIKIRTQTVSMLSQTTLEKMSRELARGKVFLTKSEAEMGK